MNFWNLNLPLYFLFLNTRIEGWKLFVVTGTSMFGDHSRNNSFGPWTVWSSWRSFTICSTWSFCAHYCRIHATGHQQSTSSWNLQRIQCNKYHTHYHTLPHIKQELKNSFLKPAFLYVLLYSILSHFGLALEFANLFFSEFTVKPCTMAYSRKMHFEFNTPSQTNSVSSSNNKIQTRWHGILKITFIWDSGMNFFWSESHFEWVRREKSLKRVDDERILCCDVHVMNIIRFFFV
jgi:hypothetical protein